MTGLTNNKYIDSILLEEYENAKKLDREFNIDFLSQDVKYKIYAEALSEAPKNPVLDCIRICLRNSKDSDTYKVDLANAVLSDITKPWEGILIKILEEMNVAKE